MQLMLLDVARPDGFRPRRFAADDARRVRGAQRAGMTPCSLDARGAQLADLAAKHRLPAMYGSQGVCGGRAA